MEHAAIGMETHFDMLSYVVDTLLDSNSAESRGSVRKKKHQNRICKNVSGGELTERLKNNSAERDVFHICIVGVVFILYSGKVCTRPALQLQLLVAPRRSVAPQQIFLRKYFESM